MTGIVSIPPRHPDMSAVDGLSESPILPMPEASALIRKAQFTLNTANATDDQVRSAAKYLIRHGNWMDVQGAASVLEAMNRRHMEAMIEAEPLTDWPECGPDVPMQFGLRWVAVSVLVVVVWPLICLWLATWWVL